MPFRSKLIAAVALLVLVLPVRSAFAADDLDRVLRELDTSAANFRSTSADFQFDTYQTDPIPEKDTQKGAAFYDRKGAAFQMSAHIAEMNGKPSPRTYTYSGGVLRLFEPLIDQVTTFKSAGKFESYIMLGFGASGKDLADKLLYRAWFALSSSDVKSNDPTVFAKKVLDGDRTLEAAKHLERIRTVFKNRGLSLEG